MNLMLNFNKRCLNKLSKINLLELSKYYCCRHISSSDKNGHQIDEEVIKNEREFQDLNVKQFKSLAKNENQMKEIESILNNYEYQKYITLEVPTTLTLKQMSQLLEMDTSEERNRYLSHLYYSEIKSIVKNRFKDQKKSLKKEELAQKWNNSSALRSGIFDTNGDIVYGLWHNSLFTRISPQYLRRYSNNRLRTAALFGQNIVFDLTCPPTMKSSECLTKLRQLSLSYTTNRHHLREAFNLSFCNLDKNSILSQTIQQNNVINSYSNLPYFLSDFTQKSYLDLFERKSLVYLTPNAEKEMDFNPNKVYIISFADGFDLKNYRSILNRKENIEIRRLPIDRHVFWSGHTKDLKSFVVLKILNDVREGIPWKDAIERNVPKNFIKSKEIVDKEEAFRLEKHTRQRKTLIDLKQIME